MSPTKTTSLQVLDTSLPFPNVDTTKSQQQFMGRGQCIKQPSVLLNDFVVNKVTETSPILDSTPSITHALSKPYPITNHVSSSFFFLKCKNFIGSISSHIEPQSYSRVVKHACWRATMHLELMHLKLIVLGHWNHCLHMSNLQGAYGFFSSSTTLMELLNATRISW